MPPASRPAAAASAPDRLLVEAFALSSRDDASRAQMADTLQMLEDLISENIRLGIAAHVLDAELGAEAVSAFFSSWIMGIIVHRAIYGHRPPRDEMVEVAERLLTGLAPRAPRPH